MTKVEVFDPPMCCSSGVCGPKVDKKLVEFSAALEWLRTKGVEVTRYNPAQQYEAFIGNAKVTQAVNNGGTSCLPLILVDGEVVSQGGYPAKDELVALAGIGKEKW
ncbi:MAG: arsenite efflux transporter metallochaperone ArsD [Kiritimatiellae bacterium]|nr:arsenite efflux transporter metallochaperone ArsD [Kiritimatiellia bacterium]MDD5519550.1 arsenite efflux transporter metallochaperone ArsD [Kiritimatiellia bacterium]